MAPWHRHCGEHAPSGPPTQGRAGSDRSDPLLGLAAAALDLAAMALLAEPPLLAAAGRPGLAAGLAADEGRGVMPGDGASDAREGDRDESVDGNGNGTGGDNYTLVGTPANGLFRQFGDANGDGTVAANDFIQFRLAFGGTSNIFDFDGDGAVAASDFIQFRLRFGGSV